MSQLLDGNQPDFPEAAAEVRQKVDGGKSKKPQKRVAAEVDDGWQKELASVIMSETSKKPSEESLFGEVVAQELSKLGGKRKRMAKRDILDILYDLQEKQEEEDKATTDVSDALLNSILNA